jgi:hypothetical protein
LPVEPDRIYQKPLFLMLTYSLGAGKWEYENC